MQTTLVFAEKLFKPEITCTRFYTYHNKVYPVDSSRKQDGEGLRPIFKGNPDAAALLNNYQSTLKSSNMPAYVGTVGVAIALGGAIAAGDLAGSRIRQRNYRFGFLALGFGIAGASYWYSQKRVAENEKTLEKALSVYNGVTPKEDQIRVGFEPAAEGTGGQIKTQVPF